MFTEWYRSRGRNFDITNNTRFDQMFIEGRDIFESLSRVADRVFNNFIKRLGRAEPYFSIYFDGRQATCCGMSQWGSEALGRRGYTPIQILRNYYPNDIEIYESTNFANHEPSYPGTPLREGASGDAVRTVQMYLNRISGDFWMPNVGQPDGIFGPRTRESVMAFQRIFNLAQDGVVGPITWYALVRIFVAVKRLAELDSEGKRIGIGRTPPLSIIRLNSRGEDVVKAQFLLNFIGDFYEEIPHIPEDGVYREATRQAVLAFQQRFGLTVDGVIGPNTWRRLYEVYHRIYDSIPPRPEPDLPAFPGVPLAAGSRGNDVSTMQMYLSALSRYFPSIPSIRTDGIFGPLTQGAVIAFQRQFNLPQTGIIDRATWYKIIEEFTRAGGEPLPPVPPPPGPGPEYPGTPLRNGSRGENVRTMQTFLNAISRVFPVIPQLATDGIFGPLTENSVRQFQRLFGLNADGVIGPITWGRIVSVFNNLPSVNNPAYPGAALRNGSRGENVRLMQRYLNTIRTRHPSITRLAEDGIFGPITEGAVRTFQRIVGIISDGVIGPITWANIVSQFNLVNTPIQAAEAAPRPRNDTNMAMAMMLMQMLRFG